MAGDLGRGSSTVCLRPEVVAFDEAGDGAVVDGMAAGTAGKEKQKKSLHVNWCYS